MQMGIFRANPKGRVFPGGLFCREARQGDQPLASLPFAHPIPERERRNPVEFFNSLLMPCRRHCDGPFGATPSPPQPSP